MASSSASSVPLSSGSGITVASSSAVGASSGSTGSPCAACKFLRRKCQPDCMFAPYFPPDNPQKFVHVHRVFGASNVTKLLNELHPYQREDAVNSLAYEADMRLRDPVYGCVGVISVLQQDLTRARYELSKYQAAAAAAAPASVGSNGAPSMADFIGNTVPNCTQNFINISHSLAGVPASFGPPAPYGVPAAFGPTAPYGPVLAPLPQLHYPPAPTSGPQAAPAPGWTPMSGLGSWDQQSLANSFSAMTLTPPATNDWYMDSGASSHMTPDAGSSVQERDRQVQ